MHSLTDLAKLQASFDQALSAHVLTNVSSGLRNAPLKKKKSNQPNDNYKVSLCNHWLLDGVCHFNEDCHFAHGEEEINDRSERNEKNTDLYATSQEKIFFVLTPPIPEHNVFTILCKLSI